MRCAAVHAGSTAALAGVSAGDLVVSLGGHPVRSLQELRTALRGLDEEAEFTYPRPAFGGSVEITFSRDGALHTGLAPVLRHPSASGVEYGQVELEGLRLRTLRTRPSQPAPTVLFLQGLGCDTVEGEPIASVVRAWAPSVGTLRVERPGVGDSDGGPFSELDFETEVAMIRAVLREEERVVLFGHSVGGMVAPLVADPLAVMAVIVFGASSARWSGCLAASTRRQLAGRGASESEIERTLARERHELATYPTPFGRAAAFHRQLEATDLAAAWARVDKPTLVLHGENDDVVGEDESRVIAGLAQGTFVRIPAMDHAFHPLHPAFVETTLAWIDSHA